MVEEYKALIDNGTWRLVPRPPRANVVSGKWIFKHKYHSNCSLARHKVRWVVCGFSQQHSIDFDETFSLVVKPATIRVILSLAFHQLDVKNAFLHGHLEETVYCQQPPGFVDPTTPDHVCLLRKSLYGLKQTPRAWYQRFTSYIRTLGFVASVTDTSLFVYKEGGNVAYMLLYIDDIVLTTSSADLLHLITERLHSEFAMTDLGGTSSSAGMAVCHSTTTLVDTRANLSATDGNLVDDASQYRSLASALHYITLTCPDIAYAVQQVCLFMHDPREPHLAMIKRILRYVKGTLSTGLHIGAGPVDSLIA